MIEFGATLPDNLPNIACQLKSDVAFDLFGFS